MYIIQKAYCMFLYLCVINNKEIAPMTSLVQFFTAPLTKAENKQLQRRVEAFISPVNTHKLLKKKKKTFLSDKCIQ